MPSKMFIRCNLELSKMRGSTSNSVKNAYPMQSGPFKNAREYVKYRQKCLSDAILSYQKCAGVRQIASKMLIRRYLKLSKSAREYVKQRPQCLSDNILSCPKCTKNTTNHDKKNILFGAPFLCMFILKICFLRTILATDDSNAENESPEVRSG